MAEAKTLEQAGTETPSPGTWKLDPSHTNVGFVARHLMVTKVRGRFTDVDGEIHIGETPEDSGVQVRIGAASIDSGDQRRDEHLRSPDFLDIERFPELTFRSTDVEVTGDTTLKVSGLLTIRAVSKPVVLDVEYEGVTADPWGNTKAGFTATTEIEREQFGITWNAVLEGGGVLVSNKVKVEIDVQAALVAEGS